MIDYTTILEVVHGSHAQGLATETSDVDVKGIIVGPRGWYFGFEDAPEQVEPNGDQDYVLFELRKFFRLAAAANPTALEVLWVSEKHVRRATLEGRSLDWLAMWARRHLSGVPVTVHAYPEEDGGVCLEWDVGRRSYSLSVDIIGHTGYLHRTNLDENDYDDADGLNLDEHVECDLVSKALRGLW